MGSTNIATGLAPGQPSFRWAALVTISLVWYVGASTLPGGIGWIDERLLLHASAALFLGLTLVLYLQRPGPVRWLTVIGLAVCAGTFIAMDVSSAGPILNIVLVALLPAVMGIRRAVIVAVAINLAHILIQIEFHGDTFNEALLTTALYGCFQLFSLLMGHFAQQAADARSALEATNAELLATRSLLESSTRDRERLRVSRELHDTAGHTLTALKLQLRRLRNEGEPSQRAALDDCLELAAGLLDDIRALVGNLRAHDPLDLRHALEQLISPFDQPAFRIEVAPDLDIDDMAVAESLLAVARESITNVVRHARAQVCTIRVKRGDGSLVLEVEDDGTGIRGAEGFGIQGMRERMKGAGRQLEIRTREPRGTRVTARWAEA